MADVTTLKTAQIDHLKLAEAVLAGERDYSVLGVSEPYFRRWICSSDAANALQEVRERYNQLLDSKLTSLIERSALRMQEQLDAGEIKPGDVVKLFAAVFDKRQLLRGKFTSATPEQRNLSDIADYLRDLTAGLRKEGL